MTQHTTTHTVSITMGDNTLSVDCAYTHFKGDIDTPECHEVDIERIFIGMEDVTELLAGMYVKRPSLYPTMQYVSVWEKIEQQCLEKIWENNNEIL